MCVCAILICAWTVNHEYGTVYRWGNVEGVLNYLLNLTARSK